MRGWMEASDEEAVYFIRRISIISSNLMQFISNLTLYSNLNADPTNETRLGTTLVPSPWDALILSDNSE
jgi:hypothetical protein